MSLPSYISKAKNINWYPGHMEKSLRILGEYMTKHQIGMVIEVRDSRVPLSSVNWKFEQFFDSKAYKSSSVTFRNAWGDKIGTPLKKCFRMVVYNKTDLVDGPQNPSVSGAKTAEFDKSGWRRMIVDNSKYPCVFTSMLNKHSAEQILNVSIRQWVQFHGEAMKNTPSIPYPHLNILVIGSPNTGKSSIINLLRSKGLNASRLGSTNKVATTGKSPGVTRHVSSKIKIVDTETFALGSTSVAISNALNDEYDLKKQNELEIVKALKGRGIRLKAFVMDSPGILPPVFSDRETALKLALANLVPISVDGVRGADAETVAEYLWWRMREKWSLAPHFLESKGWSGDVPERVPEVLKHIYGYDDTRNEQEFLSNASLKFLKEWQEGEFYRQMGLFPTKGKIQSAKQRRILNKDVWKVTMLDDEFLDGDETVKNWFDNRYK